MACDSDVEIIEDPASTKMDLDADDDVMIIESMDVKLSQEEQLELNKKLAEKKKDEGNLAYTAKKYTQALELYSQAIGLCPQSATYYNNRSACLLMMGQHRQALQQAREAVRLDPKYVKGLLRIAKCQVILGDVAGSDSALKEAAALESHNPGIATERRNLDAVTRLSHELDLAWQKGDYRRALFCAERALTVATGSAQLRVRRAECLVLLGRYAEAQDIVQDMLRADSMNADALYVRGMCLYYQDDVDRALTHFQQVLRLAPDHQRARHVYKQAKSLKTKKDEGNMAFKKDKLQEALRLYTEALAIDPHNRSTNSKLFFNRATVQSRLNNNEQAVADCSQAIKLDSGYVKAYLRRAKCHMNTEEYEEAVRDYEKVCSMDRSQEHRRLLAEAKLELKKSKRKDYYKILDLSRTATTDEIKKAYRKQALVHHPDRHSNASPEQRKEQEHRFKEVGEAYSVLSDRNKRARYDTGQDLDDADGFSGADVDHSNIFQAFFGGQAPGGFRFNMGGQQPFDFGHGGGGGGFQYTFG
ncbi:dnaJ homolog subfamily C member 7-like [Pollicipes pollicipes]|uniref:dnaJ homolog subfamily C member 7-like n=1 Tax=Pollicipes pollicipes TaxID=41117 RepID=UPI0018852DF4|nr:dnaJ homolog subfamily C member 7-like [Pollicipes pollicipes]XP_037086027.1 dnaJ homolog subfamily C member 7-like [Pollicipes pollicipes]